MQRFVSLLTFIALFFNTKLVLASDWQTLQREIAPKARDRLLEVFSAAEQALAFPGVKAGLSLEWYVSVLWPVIIIMIIAWFLARQINRWGRKHFAYLYNPNPADRTEKISYLAFSFVMRMLGTVLFVIASFVMIAIITGNKAPDANLQSILVLFVAAINILWLVMDVLIAADAPSHRLVNIGDQAALNMRRNIMIAHIPTSLMITICLMMEEVGLEKDVHLFFLVTAYTISAVAWSVVVVIHRKDVAGMITGIANLSEEDHEGKRGFVNFVAVSWHIIFIGYLILAWASTIVRLLTGMEAAHGLLAAPVMILLMSIGAYGIAILIIDRVAVRFGAYRKKILASNAIENDNITNENFQEIEHYEQLWQADLVRLAEKAVVFLIFIFAVGAIFEVWGIDVSSSESLAIRLADIFVVSFFGYLIYQAVKLTLDRKIQEETAGEEEGELGDEGGGAGSASRIATLLPLFRNFMLITIAAISIMLVLTQMGVDIGPLFAGAGVVGVAIGFGAQTLIQDIFSGAFFLFDDAFRKGEYVDVEGTRGTVEKISIRSFQLRHHLGALHTIPFGEIKQLTNYSRDWAMMKLSLRVTYDTDVEKVRKLIKKLGQELMEHPEIGSKFIQPLKSQGVFAMEDSAMILRVKFMTPPGEQFVVRKQVYLKIQELFAEHGIKFAHREVTVRVAQEEGQELSDAEKQAIAEKAVAGALENENAPTETPDR